MKAIINARIVLEDGILEGAALTYDRVIHAIHPDGRVPEGCECLDAGGRLLLPGLIDVHMHGYCGREVTEATPEAIRAIAASLVRDGVTGFLPTLGSAPMDTVCQALDAIRLCLDDDAGGATVYGAHMEGVFISPEKRGAHDISLLHAPDEGFLERYADVIRIMVCAPELYPDFVSQCVSKGIVASMGHTNATYAQAMEGVRRGISQATHLFNAMRGLNHREPGVAGAALVSDSVRAELIADTMHVSGLLFPLIYRCKGPDRILLITDSSIAAGMGPGVYRSNNRTIYVDESIGRLENGTISGSVLPLRRGVANFNRCAGAPLWECVRMASLNPARALGLDREVGSLRVGKRTNMFLADDQLNVEKTFIGGKCVYGGADIAAIGL